MSIVKTSIRRIVDGKCRCTTVDCITDIRLLQFALLEAPGDELELSFDSAEGDLDAWVGDFVSASTSLQRLPLTVSPEAAFDLEPPGGDHHPPDSEELPEDHHPPESVLEDDEDDEDEDEEPLMDLGDFEMALTSVHGSSTFPISGAFGMLILGRLSFGIDTASETLLNTLVHVLEII